MQAQIGQDIWLAIVGLLFTIIQALLGLIVGYLIFEIKKLNKLIAQTTKELIELRSEIWSKDRLDTFFELSIHRHKDECERCAVDCLNYRSYKLERMKKEENERTKK